MLQITKIFHFEMAHAIDGYKGPCRNIHGHSYELHVTIAGIKEESEYLPVPGFILDFKELKRIVVAGVIELFDHKLLLSASFLTKNPGIRSQENLLVWNAEPTAENILVYIKNAITKNLPAGVLLTALKLYETKDSYAEWVNRKI